MDVFNKIGKKATKAYRITAKKTGQIAKETKIKLKINELKSEIDDLYNEIGKKIYEKYTTNKHIDNLEEYLEEELIKIDVLSAQIDTNLKESLELKDKKQCENCFANIDINANFCPNCGQKQEKEPAKELEVLEEKDKNNVNN